MVKAPSRAEVQPCRCKPRSAVTLTDEEQDRLNLDTKFMDLVSSGDIEGVKKMIEANQEVNVGDDSSSSSCHKAMALSDGGAMMRLLVDNGAFADYCDMYGNRPINAGMQNGETSDPLVEYLLSLTDPSGERVVDLKRINQKSGNSVLMDAAWVGNTHACKELLKTGAFSDLLEHHNKQGQTAMHIAAFRAPKDLVAALVDAGANSNAPEKNGRRLSKETPEMMAAAMGRDDTAQYLKDLNVAVNAVKFGARMKMKKGGGEGAAA